MTFAKKPILCLDFDGVLHAYTSGWRGATVIPDRLVAGAGDFLSEAVEAFDVAVFSSRSHVDYAIAAMKTWLAAELQIEQGRSKVEAMALISRIRFPTEKPAAFLTLDDRALTFTGQWPAITELQAFRPWWERG